MALGRETVIVGTAILKRVFEDEKGLEVGNDFVVMLITHAERPPLLRLKVTNMLSVGSIIILCMTLTAPCRGTFRSATFASLHSPEARLTPFAR